MYRSAGLKKVVVVGRDKTCWVIGGVNDDKRYGKDRGGGDRRD